MLDVEDFNAVFQGAQYNVTTFKEIEECQFILGGKTFFERLLELLKINGNRAYPPSTPQKLEELHRRIVSSDTTLHNKHCLIFYLLKDLAPTQHGNEDLSSAFAREVHLESRYWTFIEGLWALDRLEFSTAVTHLTHPSIIPTFPDEIMYTLLKCRDGLLRSSVRKEPNDDKLPLAYYSCVKPPLESQKVRTEFAMYLADRNVTETYYWIHERPMHEQQALMEVLIEQTLEKGRDLRSEHEKYTREEKAMELVSLPLTHEEEDLFENFLTEGKGRNFDGAIDTVMMRRVATGRFADFAGENGTRGKRVDGVTWESLRDGVKKGLGPRKNEQAFSV